MQVSSMHVRILSITMLYFEQSWQRFAGGGGGLVPVVFSLPAGAVCATAKPMNAARMPARAAAPMAMSAGAVFPQARALLGDVPALSWPAAGQLVCERTKA
eukprot:SAG31_NODE_23734_length_497_cov_1.155779_2_plen_101_part_00